MIVNSYAVLDAFVSLLRLGLGLLVLWLGFAALLRWARHPEGPEDRKTLEDRCYLLYLLAGLLLVLNVASWPLFYLLLQSYVPQWPGVMCVYGVTKIGTGSLGPSRFLPPLLTSLQAAKPVLIFLSGAWFVLYLVNRRTRTAPLTGRVVVLVLAAGLLATADAAGELVYLGIPKKEEFPPVGCCGEAFDGETRATRLLPAMLVDEGQAIWLYGAYYTVNIGMVLALAVCDLLSRRRRLAAAWLGPLLAGALLAGAVNGFFLVEAAAPRLLGLPFHHCPYDLIPSAPESLVAVLLFLIGCFSIGWACVAAWLGRDAETRPLLPGVIGRLLHLGLLCWLSSLIMMSLELALA
jgi:hypothetical protein